ncbi:MAG TPA: ABC transporter substrate-binding protein [Desulfobacterales bacterium]|nr:ABC transporter substrate-binding protein [Desulfobacterales bacterium]
MRKSFFFIAAVLTISAFMVPGLHAASRSEVLVIGMATNDIVSLDPQVAFEFSSTGVDAQIYDRLFDYLPGKYETAVPSVAESWKVSDDGKTWTFHIKKGIKFHSGNPLTADDVVYSIQRLVGLNDQPAFILTQFDITADSARAVDKHTVEITMGKKYAGGIFMACMASVASSIVDSKVVRQHVTNTDKYPQGDFGTTWLSRNSAGSGPFVLSKWEKGDKLVLDANKDHFEHLPKIRRIIIKDITEAASRRLQVEKGDVDIAWDMTQDDVKSIKANKDLVVMRYSDDKVYYLGMNVLKEGLKDNRVRTAIRYAIDYKALTDDLLGGAARQTGTFIPKGFAGFEDKIFYKKDTEKARGLMKEAGYADGLELQMDHSNQTPYPELAQAIQNHLAQVGIRLTLNQMVSSQLWPKYRAQKHDMILARWGPDYSDPHTNAQPFGDYKAKQLCWRNAYYNDVTSDLVKKASLEMDNDKRIAIYKEINGILQKDGPYAFIMQTVYQHAVRKNVVGFYPAAVLNKVKMWSISKK